MDTELKDLARAVLAYAMLQRASSVITERQYQGIIKAIEIAEPHLMLNICNYTLHALNENYERKLKAWIENNSLIVRP